jgi:hypothetical protein
MKPIFVIQMPKDTPPSMLGEIYQEVYKTRISEDYHVLITIGSDTTATFKCFNSPYTKEEYGKLEELINEIKEDCLCK